MIELKHFKILTNEVSKEVILHMEFEDEEEGVFTSLEMFTETTKGIGW